MQTSHLGAINVTTIGELYLRRAALPYAQAFSRANALLGSVLGHQLAIVSSPTHAVELLKRQIQPLSIAGSGSFDAAQFVVAADGWAGGTLEAVTLESQSKTYASVVWAEPETTNVNAIAHGVRKIVDPGAMLAVVSSTLWRVFLPVWHTPARPAQEPVAPGEVCTALREAGWRIKGLIPVHGPSSLVWRGLSVVSKFAFSRPDWEDKFMFAARASDNALTMLWRFAPVVIIVAQAG